MLIPANLPPSAVGRFILRMVLLGGLGTIPRGVAVAQMLVPPWGDKLAQVLAQYQTCDMAGHENTPTACNVFLARALETVYGINDFRDPNDSSQYLEADMIFVAVQDSSKWQEIGTADQDAALVQAKGLADSSVPVIAVQFGNPHGHVALILPGDFSTTSWGSHTPNSASFFLNRPIADSYVGLPLSKAWKKADRSSVHLFRHL